MCAHHLSYDPAAQHAVHHTPKILHEYSGFCCFPLEEGPSVKSHGLLTCAEVGAVLALLSSRERGIIGCRLAHGSPAQYLEDIGFDASCQERLRVSLRRRGPDGAGVGSDVTNAKT